MKNRKIRKCFDRERHQLKFRDENGDLLKKCLVQQHETDDTLIQNILKKYDATGVYYHVNQAQASYQDNTKFNEYQDMLDKVQRADAYFKALPSHIRERFDNNTGLFLEFVNDDNNMESMYDLGLVERPEDPSGLVSPETAQEAPKQEENQAE